MKVIGLTGVIGSGKSTMAGFLEELGAVVIDADELGHMALEEPIVKQEIINAFGKRVLGKDGKIDRQVLGELVFSQPEMLPHLNAIVHPTIGHMMEKHLKKCQRAGEKAVIAEIPLLVETGWNTKVDKVWVTTAPEGILLKRLAASKGFTKKEALARLNAQMPASEMIRHADVVINTDTSLEELKATAKELWNRLNAA